MSSRYLYGILIVVLITIAITAITESSGNDNSIKGLVDSVSRTITLDMAEFRLPVLGSMYNPPVYNPPIQVPTVYQPPTIYNPPTVPTVYRPPTIYNPPTVPTVWQTAVVVDNVKTPIASTPGYTPSQIAAAPNTSQAAGQPLPFFVLIALAIGAVGAASVRVRGRK